MTTAMRSKGAGRTNVDRFLMVLRVVLLGLIAIGLLAFLAQQIAPDNAFAKWTHDGEAANRLTGAQFKGLIVSGLSQGAMYGLIALGYSMVYGVLGFINFAHGEVFMVGAFTGFIMSNKFDEAGYWEGGAFVPAVLFTVVIATLVATLTAVIMERVAYRPLRGSPRLIPLITSIGVSFFIQNAVILLFGPGAKSYPRNPDWLQDKWIFGIEGVKIVVIIVAALSMAGLWYFVERTKTGKAMRAVAEDKEIASLMGINVNRTIVTTFAVGGAMAGGLSLGSAESLAPLMLLEPLGVSGVSQLRDAVSFTLLILVLLIKPTGLFGERLSSEDRA